MPADLLAQDRYPHEQSKRCEWIDDLSTSATLRNELHVAHVDEYFLVLRIPDELHQSRKIENGFTVNNADETLPSDQHL